MAFGVHIKRNSTGWRIERLHYGFYHKELKG